MMNLPVAPDGTIYTTPEDETLNDIRDQLYLLTKMVDTVIGLQVRLIDRDKFRQEVLAGRKAMAEASLAAEVEAEYADPAMD
jgi:hypothetical protein